MCIRDRLEYEPVGAVHLRRTVDSFIEVAISPDIGFGGVVSVSYTHLRAHETVLDLVCRLLLEKKKNNTIYEISNHTY